MVKTRLGEATRLQYQMTRIGIIGGTGDLGSALAVHLSKNHEVMLGSRNSEKAKTTVGDIIAEKNHDYLNRNLKPVENNIIASECDFLILTVPHSNVLETVRNVAPMFRGNQILVSAAAVVSKKGDEFVVDDDPSGKSLAQKIREIIPESVKVAAAFQTIPANILYREKEISADVPVAAESVEDYQLVASIVSEIQGLRPLHLGSLQQAGEIERLTVLLLNIAKKNGLKSPTTKFPSF